MHKLLAALGAATLLSGVMLGNPAKAMTVATPSAVGVVAGDTGLVQKVRYYGYYHHYGYYHRPYYGYYRHYGYYHRPYYGYYHRPYYWGYRRWYW